MAYDFHQFSEGVTGATSPLYAAVNETSPEAIQNNVVSVKSKDVEYIL